jgi:hypothetical protein
LFKRPSSNPEEIRNPLLAEISYAAMIGQFAIIHDVESLGKEDSGEA